ncbi:hypothetical protein BLS_006559 [Venturia inaequalis]|uniref:Uncharacterized protein n=1 Tax=Venturia inaequalis TaxID=5025 RepID=A0A8H3UD70_VENIN|nr:hypothetical protein BLS_006559 [Venturia inaequalis]KAE9970261.1 hypothetical protein EG328_006366 [Venturia inaequalis]
MYTKSFLVALLASLATAAPANMTSVTTTLANTPPTKIGSTDLAPAANAPTSPSSTSPSSTNPSSTSTPLTSTPPTNTTVTITLDMSTSTTSTLSTSTLSTSDGNSDYEDTTPEYNDAIYWDEEDDRQFIIMSYQPNYVKNKSSVIHKNIVQASGDSAFATNETVETLCVPGADCSLVHNETIFSFSSTTGRLRLDSLARTQNVFFEEYGEMTYQTFDDGPFDEDEDVAVLQGGWTHEPSSTIDGAGILKFDDRGFYCCDLVDVWPNLVIYADMSLIKERPEGRCFQIDLMTFPPNSTARPYAYGSY